jgi:hypothetical protein
MDLYLVKPDEKHGELFMSIFSETMTKAIADYRFLLRRYLSQADRMTTLTQLKLRDSDTYESDAALFETGKAIIANIEANMAMPNQGYYSYSGIQQFCEYLKEYLDNYFIDAKKQVVHRTQKASRALIEAIQLSALPQERLNDRIAKRLYDCNTAVVDFGSQEQWELQRQTLVRQKENNPGFYSMIIAHLESLLTSGSAKAA